MFLGEIATPVSQIKGVGPAVEKLFARLGIFTAGQLLSFWPQSWDDRTAIIPIADFASFPKVNTVAHVIAHDWFGFGRMRTLKITIRDDSAAAVLVCFNRPFLEKTLPVGAAIKVCGSFSVKYGSIQSSAFEAEVVQTGSGNETLAEVASTIHGAVLPVYRLCAGLSQAKIRNAVHTALTEYTKGIEDELPSDVMARNNVMSKAQAIRLMHEPPSIEAAMAARQSLIFEELFHFQYSVGRRAWERHGRLPEMDKGAEVSYESAVRHSDAELTPGTVPLEPAADNYEKRLRECLLSPLQKRLLDRLQFTLTADQLTVLAEINADLNSALQNPESKAGMARLLQGDVGSGKTLVAFLAMVHIVDEGGQAALLAPTELLARQHAENAARLLEPIGVRLAFFTGNVKSAGRVQLLQALKNGDIDIVVGTHALFSKDVTYKNLRLAVIDEQHRFGVLQRAAITAKGRNPHVLMMSATPIPRTLALTVFGDLDVSVIRTMPPGRKPVITHLARQGNEQKVYDYVRNQLQSGRQAYFVYPLIENIDSEQNEETQSPAPLAAAQSVRGQKSAVEMCERLSSEQFPGYRCALIHSRVPEDEQRQIMEDFRLGKINVLVATSVVEVGVDVPNATVMVIEHADRFGLSALHQLRGRVGRGEFQSYCFLVYSASLSETGKARLKIMHEHTDGFLIAEEDMKLRGPGEASGIQQSGYFTLSIADPLRDCDTLLSARKESFALIQKDPGLIQPESACVRKLWNRVPPFRDVSA